MQVVAKLVWILVLAVPLSLPIPLAAQDEVHFSQAELDQMLAPIALYPDTLLSHILIASTYPLEVVQAARWSRDNPGLEGEVAVAAVEVRNWDPSVKALVAFPQVLTRMDEDLEWTQRLGEAFLAQENEVADRIQSLRARARDAGHLDSLEHVRVYREPETIIIEPAASRIVYVPYYDTRVIYGGWWWPAYPPIYWAYPHGYPVSYYGSTWFSWGPGIYVSPFFFFSSFHWPYRHVVVVHHHNHPHHHRHRFHSGRDVARHNGARKWQHDPKHRRGVAYNGDRRHHDRGRNDAREHWQARDTRRDGPRESDTARREPQRPALAGNRPELLRHRAESPRAETRPQDGQVSRRSGTALIETPPATRTGTVRFGTHAGTPGRFSDQPNENRTNENRTRRFDVRRDRTAVRSGTPVAIQNRRVDAGRREGRPVPVLSVGERQIAPRTVGRERSTDRDFSRNIPTSASRNSRSEGRRFLAPATRNSSEGNGEARNRGQGRFSSR